jgi:hypothetical protein
MKFSMKLIIIIIIMFIIFMSQNFNLVKMIWYSIINQFIFNKNTSNEYEYRYLEVRYPSGMTTQEWRSFTHADMIWEWMQVFFKIADMESTIIL